jgi:uroporphyrinogen-III synthase
VRESRFDCLLITRPQAEAENLAAQLGDLGLSIVIQPAHEFAAVQVSTAVLADLQQATHSGLAPLLVFTSTRAVHFALQQLPLECLSACQLAAIGPATALALQQAGFEDVIQPENGYTSEDLLRTLDRSSVRARQGWIVAAEGGREALLRGLQQRGVAAGKMLVYKRGPAPITGSTSGQLDQSKRILSVWTSADAIKQLAQGLSATAWQRVCAGHWLVVSQRLAGVAAELAADVSVSAGPGNADLAGSVRQLYRHVQASQKK